jgi:two-component system nitrogen regulation sensor histidine kinase GlnL
MRETLLALQRDEVTSGRFEAQLRRAPLGSSEPLLVRVSASQMDTPDWVLLEIVEIEQQTRQDREERALGLVQANKELLRNLAHEIKNPLGGIRGAAQLLEMELVSQSTVSRVRGALSLSGRAKRAGSARGLTEYTQVIIHEADRLQALVDRLLAPHRKPHVVGDVNIHEVCERVRLLISSEFPKGLEVQRDYDTSIPEFRGDREQLIQAVLNIVRNATEALAEQIAAGSARLVLRTRIARQVTIGKQRYRLALELHIQDNGPGVPESIRDRIFHPLVSGREGGSGLGLTLAQTFVQQHRGTIEYDSVPGRTDFKILIPLP